MYFFFSDDKNAVNDGMKIGAFACRKREYKPEFILPDVPLSNLLPKRKEENCEENDLINEELEHSKTSTIKDDRNGNSPSESLITSNNTTTTVSTSDDFIMVDLVIFCINMLHVA